MDLQGKRIYGVHHLTVESDSPHLALETYHLRPYHLNDGAWYLKIQHIALTSYPVGEGEYSNIFKFISTNAVSGNAEPLTLVSFTQDQIKGRAAVFPLSENHKLTSSSDLIHLSLQTVDGKEVNLAGGKLLVGVALTQVEESPLP